MSAAELAKLERLGVTVTVDSATNRFTTTQTPTADDADEAKKPNDPKIALEEAPELKRKDVKVMTMETVYGTMRLTVEGELSRPVILTYHDIGLSHEACFDTFFNFVRRDRFFQQFTIVHIDAPGHFTDAKVVENYVDVGDSSRPLGNDGGSGDSSTGSSFRWFDCDELVVQIHDAVTKVLKIKSFVAFGAGAGGYLLTSFAIKYPAMVNGLIAFGLSSRKAGWYEWGDKKWAQYMKNWTSYAEYWEHYFLYRWFALNPNVFDSDNSRATSEDFDLIVGYRRELSRLPEKNALKFIDGFLKRRDITGDLKKIRCPTLLFVGDNTELQRESEHAMGHMNSDRVEWLRIRECGLLITEQQPGALLEPIKLFCNGIGYF